MQILKIKSFSSVGSYFTRIETASNLLSKSLSQFYGRHIMTDKELRSAGQYDVGSPCDLELCTSALSITALPTEVLAHVFEYLPYRVVAQDLRLVSRRFRDVATLVLNSGFLTLGPTIERTKMVVKSRVMQAPAETELTTVCRTLYELKTLKSEVS